MTTRAGETFSSCPHEQGWSFSHCPDEWTDEQVQDNTDETLQDPCAGCPGYGDECGAVWFRNGGAA